MERKTLYITRQGARLHRVDGLVAVSVDRTVVERWPADEIERALLFGNVQLSTQAMALLLRHGVQVSFFSSSGRYRGQVVPAESGNVFIRLAQHARHADHGFRLALARDLVRLKITAARALIRRFSRNHPETAPALDDAADALGTALAQLDAAADCDALRGHEGAAAARYFQAFDAMVRPPFRFERRSKHPAHNPVNALLNLGYTMLTGEIASRLEGAGFDPRIGYYHGIRYGRSSLALDLVEAHRVDVIDRLTLSILNRRMLAPEDFEDRGGALGVRLKHAALRRYLTFYESTLGDALPDGEAPRARIQWQVDALRRSIMTGCVTPADEAACAGAAAQR